MITVEFYGIPRARAGVASIKIEAATIGDAINSLAEQFSELARDCFSGQQLKVGYLANVNGSQFTTDPSQPLSEGDSLLIMSADSGG